MRSRPLYIPLLMLAIALTLSSCDKTPRGVMSVNAMADLIVDLQLAEAYIDSHGADFQTDSDKMVMKQSVFKKHGITQQDYDTSLVWYAHNMDDYIKAYDKAVGKLKDRYDKLDKGGKNAKGELPQEIMNGPGEPTHNPIPGGTTLPRPHDSKRFKSLTTDTKSDTADLWQGRRSYTLMQGARRGFIPFDVSPDANKRPGDRYQLAYKLMRGGNDFKVNLFVDYTDGSTALMSRGTNSDGWVTVDVQSDSTRQVRRIYGFVRYDMKRGRTAYVDSLTLMRTRLNKDTYGIIHAQRLMERRK